MTEENSAIQASGPAEREPNGGLSPSDAQIIADAVARALSGVAVYLDGEKVGRLTAEAVDSELGRRSYAGRYQRE